MNEQVLTASYRSTSWKMIFVITSHLPSSDPLRNLIKSMKVAGTKMMGAAYAKDGQVDGTLVYEIAFDDGYVSHQGNAYRYIWFYEYSDLNNFLDDAVRYACLVGDFTTTTSTTTTMSTPGPPAPTTISPGKIRQKTDSPR